MDIIKTYETINGVLGPKIIVKTDVNNFQDEHYKIIKILEDCEKNFTIYRKFLFDEKTYDMVIDHSKHFTLSSKTKQYENLFVLLYVKPEKSEDFDEIYGYFFKARLDETI